MPSASATAIINLPLSLSQVNMAPVTAAALFSLTPTREKHSNSKLPSQNVCLNSLNHLDVTLK